MEHYSSCFDFVHGRSIAAGIYSYPELLKNIWRMLKPGGIFLTMNGGFGLYGTDFERNSTTDENDPVSRVPYEDFWTNDSFDVR